MVYLIIKSRVQADDRSALLAGLAALGSTSPTVPSQSFERQPDESLKNLLADLSGPSEELRQVAKRRFSDGSGPEKETVFSLLEKGDPPELVAQAVAAAGELRLKSSVPLLGKLLSHSSPEVAQEAARSLGAIGDPKALEFLIARSEQLDEELRAFEPSLTPAPSKAMEKPAKSEPKTEAFTDVDFAADDFLPSHEPLSRILPPLAAENYRLLDRYTPYKLQKLEESAIIDLLLNIAAADDELTSNRYYAIKNLAYFRRIGLVKEVAEFLASSMPAIRYAAADTVAQLGGSAGATALLEAIKDANPYVRSAAASGLATLGDDRGLVPLMALRDDPDEVVRFSAERALQELERRKDIGSLLTLSRSSTS